MTGDQCAAIKENNKMNTENNNIDNFDLPGTMSTAAYIQHIRIQAHVEQGRAVAEFIGRLRAGLRKILAGNQDANGAAPGSDHDLAQMSAAGGADIIGLAKWTPVPGDASNDHNRRVA
jgi:hypothetical protein